MPAMPPGLLPLLLAALALVFAVLAWRARTAAGAKGPASRTYMRIAVIFALVSVGLLLFHRL
jgi:hypothetical protein